MRVRTPGPGPLFPDDGPFPRRIGRRILGIAVELTAFLLITLLFPVLLLAAAAVDLTLWLRHRKPWVGVRMLPAGWCALFAELEALVKLPFIYLLTGGPWGRGSIRRRRWIYVLRIRWARTHLWAVKTFFGVRIEVEGLDQTASGPFILMLRHASIIDNLLGDVLIGHTWGTGVRYVIKREIEALPAIDIGGRWIPTVFVKRGSLDPETEIAAVRRLAHDMSEGEIVAMYPEGTRPTPAKIHRAQEVIAERQPHVAPLAARLNHLMPPRLGGPLALIDEAASGTDIVFCAHVGFEGLRTIADLWHGALVGQTIQVRFWRHDGRSVPSREQERIEWLYARWQELDGWVGGHLAQSGVRTQT
jgi:1-acyl-sn-glycerol-3-phosphate acyltransferase